MTNSFAVHNHSTCIRQGIGHVERTCAEQGLQFTPVRRRVLEILLDRHKAMGAYDILEHLRTEGLGSQPPVVYRALDFLVRHGFAHRVEQLNAFVACSLPDADHTPAFLICRACGAVSEAQSESVAGPLDKAAREAGFTVESAVVEVRGLCPACASRGRP